MTATIAQRQFNPFKDFSKRSLPDLWHGLMKSEKRENLRALVYGFLIEGGEIIKVPAKKHRAAGRPRIFGKDSRSAAYSRDTSRFFNGHDFTQSGPRWTSKPAPDKSASKRDAERKAGVSHQNFGGAVIDINGKLRPRAPLHAVVDKAPIDLVSDAALAASAKRDGKKHIGKTDSVAVIEDTADSISDGASRATVKDDLNLMAPDREHLERFKLAA
jgi:hypothetical protein